MNKISLFKSGKQGIAGNFEDEQGNIITFKVSQYSNYLIEHEYAVMNRLEHISYCQNFCKPVCLENRDVEPKIEKKADPFKIVSKYPIKKNVLFEEFIEGDKLCKHISRKTSTHVIISAIKQVLSAISISQKLNFTHYDLHSDNVIMRKCDPDTVFLYVFNKDNAVLVPSMGYIPVIIDYGFSYIDTLDDDYMSSSMGHTDIGFTSDRFDWVADPKLFLISIIHELGDRTDCEKLKNIVFNIFSELPVDWECGWDNLDGKSVSDSLIYHLIKRHSTDSKIFGKHVCHAVDLMCSLIILPLTEKSYDEIELSYVTFIEEFKKIENEINSSQYNIYILKCIVDSAQKYMDEYYTSESTSKVVSKFRADVNSAIFSVSKFCSPRNIHYEKMLCALYNFSNCAEGMMYKFMKKSLNRKSLDYKNLKVSDINEIINILDVNLEEKYVYNENTNIVVIDNINESRESFSIDKKTIENLNRKKCSNYNKAILLYETLTSEKISRSTLSGSRSGRSVSGSGRSVSGSGSEESIIDENELSDEDILAHK